MRTILLPLASSLAVLLSVADGPRAQVPHGHALVAWKPQNPTATGGMRLVDRAGANQVVTGLSAATVGTTRWDGAQSVLVTTNGIAFAGLGADNRAGTAPIPLDVRRILMSGAVAALDQHFATLMQVPAGSNWKVSDIKERPDGSLLVAAAEILTTVNPMPQAAVFVVSPGGSVTTVPTAGLPFGSLEDIADAGDRFVVGLIQSAFIVNADFWSLPYSASGAAAYRICQLTQTSTIGGLDLDVDGTVLIAATWQGGSVVRVAHAPSSTPTQIAPQPTSAAAAEILPGPGLAAVFTQPTLVAGSLNLVDCNTGTSTQWAATVVRDPVDVSVRADSAVYGPASQLSAVPAWLGSEGGLPTTGNSGYGLRVGGKPGALGGVFLGAARANVALPFGTLLVAPSPLVALPSFTLPGSGVQHIGLPIPSNPSLVGGVLDAQGAVVDVGLSTIDLTRGLEIVVL